MMMINDPYIDDDHRHHINDEYYTDNHNRIGDELINNDYHPNDHKSSTLVTIILKSVLTIIIMISGMVMMAAITFMMAIIFPTINSFS